MAALFRLRASLYLSRAGQREWARVQGKVRRDLAQDVNGGQPNAEPARLTVQGNHLHADLPFPEQVWAEATWDTLLGIAAGGYVEAGTRQQWSGMDMHVCYNTDPPRACTRMLGEWDNHPAEPPVWDSARTYSVGDEVRYAEQWWRSTDADNTSEPGAFGWVAI